jgi:hypothetical protein
MAQNVYSLNVVGYINIPLVDGFNLIANQLDFDGTGLNNTPANILGTNVPPNTAVYGWALGGGWNIAQYTVGRAGAGWSVESGSMPTLNPGQGVWLSIPSGGSLTINSNITTVGQVDQGSLINTNFMPAGGFSLLSSIVPIAGGLQTVLNYTPLANDTVYQWSTATTPPSWIINQYTVGRAGSAWSLEAGPAGSPAEPTLSVGQGFWLSSGVGASWSNYFEASQ